MTTGSTLAHRLRLQRRLSIAVDLVFETAWRVGTGKEGTTMSDLGVLLDPTGRPILPGSSIKGRLRSTCESLAHALGLNACLLNAEASGTVCASDVRNVYSPKRAEYRAALSRGVESQLQWIDEHTCDVCKLFGSPVRTAKVRCSDGHLYEGDHTLVQVRDGVVIDRDSHTAAEGLKYDYETVSAGTRFRIVFDVENPTDSDEALLGAAIFEWHAGASIGGFTSRGLGRFHLENLSLSGVDFSVPEQRRRYLCGMTRDSKLTDVGDWESYFNAKIEALLKA
jgi:CRISPR-associated protein Csm3